MESLVLELTPDTRRVLENLLATATRLEEGARIVDHLPDEPWGDLDEFRRLVYEPLRTLESSTPSVGPQARTIELGSQDARHVFNVLEGLAEGWSGGVPWVALSPAERPAVDRCLKALRRVR